MKVARACIQDGKETELSLFTASLGDETTQWLPYVLGNGDK